MSPTSDRSDPNPAGSPLATQDRTKLESIFRTVFDDPKLEIRDDLSAADVPSWDSFNHVNLIITVETEFDIQFTPLEISDMKTVGDLWRMIGEKSRLS